MSAARTLAEALTAHTPGPWRVEIHETGIDEYCCIAAVIAPDDGFRGGEVATCQYLSPAYMGSDPAYRNRALANARAITALPDCVAALERIRDARDYCAEHGTYPIWSVGASQCFDDWAADVASAALAKVRGGA